MTAIIKASDLGIVADGSFSGGVFSGTDWTSAINSALNTQLADGGELILDQCGYYGVTSIDMARHNSIRLTGAAVGCNNTNPSVAGPGIGTVLVPLSASHPTIDMSASCAPVLARLQIGTPLQTAAGLNAVFMGQDEDEHGSAPILDQVMIVGTWSGAGALMMCGIGAGVIRDSSINNAVTDGLASFFSDENIYGMPSLYAPLRSAPSGNGGWSIRDSEFHCGTVPTGGAAVRVRGAVQYKWERVGFDASSKGGLFLAEQGSAPSNTPCDTHVFDTCAFYAEHTDHRPVNIFQVNSGTFSNVTLLNCRGVRPGDVMATGPIVTPAGSLTYQGFSTP